MPSKQASPREGEGRSVAERMAREIIPKWTNASAANTMEYENALEAQMMEGHGPVEGLLHAVYAARAWLGAQHWFGSRSSSGGLTKLVCV